MRSFEVTLGFANKIKKILRYFFRVALYVDISVTLEPKIEKTFFRIYFCLEDDKNTSDLIDIFI